MVSNHLLRRQQKGATMVEMAITLPVFLLLIFAIFEFSLLIFAWSRAVEATRAGARYAIVNDPVVDISKMDCGAHAPGSEVAPESGDCSGAGCSAMLSEMQRIYSELEGSKVSVAYQCSFTGFTGAPEPVVQVTVSISGQEHELMLPGLLGLESKMTLPAFATTRTSEDMYTYAGP